MRGQLDPQASMFSYFSPEARVPTAHPLRSIEGYADTVLQSLTHDFDELYASTGRPSIAPERLLKASLLIALYSVRSDRLFCEMLDYNMLFRWFLDMGLEEASFDHSTFSKNRERLIEHEIAKDFFAGVVAQAKAQQLLSEMVVDGGVGVARRQVHRRGVSFFLVALRRRIEGHVARREPLFHFANVGHVDSQIASHMSMPALARS